MIKSLTKLLNNRILLHKQLARFNAPKETDDSVPVDPQLADATPQQIEALKQEAGITEPGEALQVQAEEGGQVPESEEDPYEGVNLVESNWKDMAHIINTPYYHENTSPYLRQQVQTKLDAIEAMYNLDLQNLDKVKISDMREFEIKGSINVFNADSSRYLENDISENTRIGANMMTGKKFRQFLETKNMQAIKQLYRNNEFQTFVITADIFTNILDQVVSNDFENHFLLNLFEFFRVDSKNLLVPNKNFQKVLQNIHDLQELNKLKFFWKINSALENGQDHINWSVVNHQLTKITFDGVDRTESQKVLRNIYSSVLGKESMKKLMKQSLERFGNSFKDFIQFWSIFNLLITRLNGLNESSLSNPHSLNAVFNIFEINFEEPKDILTQMIPQILFETKNKMLFEIYRVHAKFWIERKADPKLSVLAGPFDEFLNKKIDLEESIRVSYNPWHAEEYFPTRTVIRTSKNTFKTAERLDEILSQTKMIDHLLKGDYSFVLNHFLLVFNPGFDKESYIELRKVLSEAKQKEFSDQNAKALYILKEINEKFLHLSEPVAFRQKFLGDFKKIKWIERKEAEPPKIRKPAFQKMLQEDQGKYSRKKVNRLDPEESFDVDNKERIYSKSKYPPKEGGLFSKKNKNLFSTQKDSYAEYREVVKELSKQSATEFGFSIKMDRNTDLNTFKEEVERRSREMNESNHKSLFAMTHLPIVGSGSNLLKYLFLKKPEGDVPQLNEQLKKKLKVSFVSQIGALEKDFSQYLEGCRFNFALAEEVYVALLEDQKNNYVRKSFKTIISHIIAYKKSISNKEIELICDVSKKNRIGITLIEFFNLMIENKVLVSKESVYLLCDTLQKFKKINGDIFSMTKKYCENVGIDFETNMMSSYVKSLLLEEQDEKLSELCEILKTELRPKPYKIKSELSAEENIRQEKEYKQFQQKESTRILKEIINIVVINVNNKLPVFVSQLFDEYEKTQTKLEPHDVAISLIVYCNDVDRFLQIVRSLRAEPEKILPFTFECAIKALRLNSKGLESHAEQIFNVTLFTNNPMLNEDLINKSVQIFKFLTSPTVYIKFLEYLLRYNPTLNYEIKSSMYYVMNNINDDFAKNTISGLLDFIFNSNREKERDEYRKAQIVEEEKAKLLQDLEKRDFFFDKTDNQKAQIINDIEAGNLEDAKKPKKNKAPEKIKEEKLAKEQKGKVKVQKPNSARQEKKRVGMRNDDDAVLYQGDGIIKKSNLKKKLRSKSLNDFEEMFAQKDEVAEEAEVKGGKGGAKGKGAPQKDGKEGKKKGK